MISKAITAPTCASGTAETLTTRPDRMQVTALSRRITRPQMHPRSINTASGEQHCLGRPCRVLHFRHAQLPRNFRSSVIQD
eukprot:2576737-Pleurochrysis_carterae.AAC.3